MSGSRNQFSGAPELTFEDLCEIKVPEELFSMISPNICKEYQILPLRHDEDSRILSVAFVDEDYSEELERLVPGHLFSGYHIKAEVFKKVLKLWELSVSLDESRSQKVVQVPQKATPKTTAIIEPDNIAREALGLLFRGQGKPVNLYENEKEFLSCSFADLKNVILRESAVDKMTQFQTFVQKKAPSATIRVLPDTWLEDFVEKPIVVESSDNPGSPERSESDQHESFSPFTRSEARYEKIESIGKGGMGTVYRAKDRVLGRDVALKVLSSNLTSDKRIVDTFLRDAKSLAALNHLHIVTIYDAGVDEDDSSYFIAMEFIEGRTVRDLLRQKVKFKLSVALPVAKQVLKALSYAHSRNIIHRDITSSNIMITESKIIKIMDFGLARIVHTLQSEQSIIGGTPYFMSPEQVDGAPIDHRTDIYSFGVCLYEMTTGQVPFPDENPGYHHLHTPAPDPRSVNPDIPKEVANAIMKSMEKDPNHRFQSAQEFLDALKAGGSH